MLLTEKAIDNFYSKDIEKWNGIKVIKIGNLGKIFSQNIHKNLQSKVNYEIKNMDRIWEYAPKEDLEMNPNGGITRLTKLLYDRDQEFNEIYKEICTKLILIFGSNKVIQRHPNIRVSSLSSNQYCPYWHSDLLVGHPIGTLNMWIPLTEPNDNEFHGFNICPSEISKKFYLEMRKDFLPYKFLENEIIIKSKILLRNSISVKASLGEAIVFDSRCFHSAMPLEKHSRVSMDIRLIDIKYLNSPYPKFQGLGRKKAKFDIGNYYM